MQRCAYLQERNYQTDDAVASQTAGVDLIHVAAAQECLDEEHKSSRSLFADLVKQLPDSLTDIEAIVHVQRDVDLEVATNGDKFDDRYLGFRNDDNVLSNA